MNRIGMQAGETAVATRQSQVQEGLESLAVQLDSLNIAIGQLEQRLSSVLLIEPPATAGKGVTIDVLCPMAARLLALTDQVRAMGQAVQSITQRCEC